MKANDSPYEGPLPPVIDSTSNHAGEHRSISFNGTQLTDQQIAQLEALYRARIPDGAYWYDTLCGAWGWNGGPCAGFIQPGLGLGGALRADASNGNTGVFINGRQLHFQEVLALQQFTPVSPGRFWVDAQGNFGYENGPLLGNLVLMAQAAGRGRQDRAGDNFWTTRFSAGNYDPNSGSGYVSVPGYGPVGFGPG